MIDGGAYRHVYILKQNPNYVVKIEVDPSLAQFANATEWRNYVNNKEWDYLKDWLAPCEIINETGQVMIQRRVTREGKKPKDYPTHVPFVFTDLKRENFGWIGEKFVCCDYSYLLTFIVKSGKSKYKRAKWWNYADKFPEKKK